MKARQARQLIAVLAVKRIPFSWRREGNAHVVAFPAERTETIAQAIGDCDPDRPLKRTRKEKLTNYYS